MTTCVLVVGCSARAVACSASRASFKVLAIDRYGDLDTKKCTSNLRVFQHRDEVTLEGLEFDYLVPTSGFEGQEFPAGVEVLGNPPGVVRRVEDKLWLANWLTRHGFPHPDTTIPGKKDVELPVILKPRIGAGGLKNRLLTTHQDLAELQAEADHHPETRNRSPPTELERETENSAEFIVQQYIPGIPASVSLVSTGEEAWTVAVNEQLCGASWLNCQGFTYAGNITPLRTRWEQEMRGMAEEIVVELGLKGSCGVDFILTPRGPVVLEVNPRFQGSLDTVELSTGVNIFKLHFETFHHRKPALNPPGQFAGRAIFYSPHTTQTPTRLQELWKKREAADIPPPGTRFKKGDPVTSLLATATTRDRVLDRLKKLAKSIKTDIKNLT